MSISLNFNTATAAAGGSELGAGIDVSAVVQQILNADRAPEAVWKSQQSTLNLQTTSWNSLRTNIASLRDKVNSLTDILGVFTNRIASSSQAAVLTASAQASAPVGTHVVTVSNLATTSSYYGGALATSSTSFATGSFVLQVGNNSPTTITVDSTNNTPDGLAAYINARALGVTATVINDSAGARLALVSQTSGLPGDLNISANTTGFSFTKSATGNNASLTIDGVPISSSSNTVSSALPGVTLQLIGTSASPVQLSVGRDEFYMPCFGTTAYENGLGCRSCGRMRSFALVEPKSPRMSLTLDAVENNGLSPSLRRGAREGDFRDLCILTSHGRRRQPWKFCIRAAAGWMYTSPPSRLVF